MKLTWSHAFVNVNNLETMLAFYTNVLGFHITEKSDRMAFLSQLDDEHHQIAFNEVANEGAKPSRVGHFAFRVESLDDVTSLYKALDARGDVGKAVPITHGNTWSIYFQDPERNGIEVFCDTPWEIDQPFGEPWDPRMSREELESFTSDLLRQRGELRPNSRLFSSND